MAPLFLILSTLALLRTFPLAFAWKSNCSPGPAPGPDGFYPIPNDVDCHKPKGRIQRCFCDREVPIYKRCVKDTLDEFVPEKANPIEIYEISVILERVSAWRHLERGVRGFVWELYDKVLSVKQHVFVESNDRGLESTQRFLSSLDRFLTNAEANVTFLDGANLGLLKRPRPKCGEEAAFLGIGDFGSNFSDLREDEGEALASIEVPAEAACEEGAESAPENSAGNGQEEKEEEREWVEGIHFVLYRKAHFFVGNSTHPSNGRFGRMASDRHTRCQPGLFADGEGHRRVLSAKIQGKNKKPAKTAAKIRYRNELPPLHGQFLVTWWQLDQSKWSLNETCRIGRDGGGLLEAECPHLTDFTLLVDGMETDPSLCDGFLASLGYALNMGSFLSLLLLNAIYIVYKSPELYQRVFVQFLGNRLPKMQLDEQAFFYTLALMVFYLCFGLFSDEGHTGGGGIFCRMVAVLNYWLLMACVLLTIFQAWRILKMFVLSVAMERALIVATKPQVALSVSFGLPALLCLVFGLSVDNFFYRNDEFCWIRPNYVWFAVVLPLSLLLANGLLCSLVIGLRLFPNTCGMQRLLERHASATIRLSKGAKRKSRNKLALLLLVQFSLGMPWVLQFATLSIPHVSLTHFLFTLVNGSQGLVLLSLLGYKQIQTWQSIRADRREAARAQEGEGVDIFTNSIGMRIPVAKSSTGENSGKRKESGKH